MSANIEIKTVARLYVINGYHRASVNVNGPGQALVLKSDADAEISELRAALEAVQTELEEWRFTNRIDELQWVLESARQQLACYETQMLRMAQCAGEFAKDAARPSQPDSEQDAAKDVLAERERQVNIEGWTPAHDDEHAGGQMANAAACYALHTEPFGNVGDYLRFWPWSSNWWRPTNRRRNLIKAGALILAEIERIDRAAMAAQQGEKGGADTSGLPG